MAVTRTQPKILDAKKFARSLREIDAADRAVQIANARPESKDTTVIADALIGLLHLGLAVAYAFLDGAMDD